ncbi:MAG: RasGEF domain-containing protein [Coxiellaceae bacterium]|nr:RasGEF domain-containing protein [Coxiellaceae bacterium]
MNDLKKLQAYYQIDPTLIHASELWLCTGKPNSKTYHELFTSLNADLIQGNVRADVIHALAADPLLKVACNNETKLRQNYQDLKQKFITTRSQALYTQSRQLFLAIPRHEFIDANITQCPNTKNIIDHYDKLNYFVQYDITNQDSINARVSAFASWLSVIKKLQQQGDYCSFSAIGQALCFGLAHSDSIKNGLSIRQLEQLQNIKYLASNPKAMQQMQNSHTQDIIPDPSDYRHRIGIYKADEQHDHTAELAHLQAQLETHQQALISNDQSVDLPCEHSAWTIVKKHKQHKKIPVSANLYHQHKYCLIAQIADPQLRQLIISKRLIIDQRITDNDIDQLNRALKQNLNIRQYASRLNKLGIELSEDEIKQVNQHNPQLYYRSLIHNPMLRKTLQAFDIHYNKTSGSTAKVIQQLNQQCRTGIKAKQLNTLLSSLGVTLDSHQIQSIVTDINRRRHLTPTPKIELLLKRANSILQQPLLKHIKKQMNDYMQLLRHETDPQQLKQYLGDILSRHGMRNAAGNPYLQTLDELFNIVNQLSELRHQLNTDKYDQQLIKRIATFKAKIHKSFFQELFDRQQLMHQALKEIKTNGQLSEESQQHARKYAPIHWSVKFKLRSADSYINSRKHTLQHRAIGEAKHKAYKDFDHLQKALNITWQRLCHFSKRLELIPTLDYNALLQQAIKAKDQSILQQIEQQLSQQRLQQHLQQAWLDYTSLVSSCSHQFQTIYDLQKKYSDAAKKVDQQYHTLWSHLGKQQGQHKKNIEDLSQLLAGRNPKRLNSIKEQINLQTFSQLTAYAKLTDRIASMRQQLQLNSKATTEENTPPTEQTQQVEPAVIADTKSNHWQQYVLWSATGLGAVALGAAGMHFAPHLVARFATLGAVSVVGIKAVVTAGSAAVGGAAGHWFEKNLLNRFGLFAVKTDNPSIDDKSDNANQITLSQ